MNHITENPDALLDYLYEEGDPAERLTIAKHLQECAACAVAVLEFQNVRGMLSDWTPPGSQLGFRVVRDSQPVSPPRSTYNRMPWLQAAAAVLLFVSGMAVSQLRVDYRDGALTVRAPSAAPAMPAGTIRNASITLPPDGTNIDEIERDLRARLQAQNASSVDIERLLQRVRAMIDQSEQRQQRELRRELALRLSQVAREVDTQHQADMLRIQQDFGQQQEATMDYLVKTSGGVK